MLMYKNEFKGEICHSLPVGEGGIWVSSVQVWGGRIRVAGHVWGKLAAAWRPLPSHCPSYTWSVPPLTCNYNVTIHNSSCKYLIIYHQPSWSCGQWRRLRLLMLQFHMWFKKPNGWVLHIYIYVCIMISNILYWKCTIYVHEI